MLQHRYFVPLALILGFGFPCIFGYFAGDFIGGLLYGGVICRLAIWHGTFCINSFAHMIGDQEFTIHKSARGNLLMALITAGEGNLVKQQCMIVSKIGYHNFHHEFPQDYRNGIYWYDYDPTKWMILLAYFMNAVHWLNITPIKEIEMARIATTEDKLLIEKRKHFWGIDDDRLPLLTEEDVTRLIEHEGKKLILIDGYIIDISNYMEQHPGGSKVLANFLGKDATLIFYKGINIHSRTAKIKLNLLKIGKLYKSL